MMSCFKKIRTLAKRSIMAQKGGRKIDFGLSAQSGAFHSKQANTRGDLDERSVRVAPNSKLLGEFMQASSDPSRAPRTHSPSALSSLPGSVADTYSVVRSEPELSARQEAVSHHSKETTESKKEEQKYFYVDTYQAETKKHNQMMSTVLGRELGGNRVAKADLPKLYPSVHYQELVLHNDPKNPVVVEQQDFKRVNHLRNELYKDFLSENQSVRSEVKEQPTESKGPSKVYDYFLKTPPGKELEQEVVLQEFRRFGFHAMQAESKRDPVSGAMNGEVRVRLRIHEGERPKVEEFINFKKFRILSYLEK